MKRTISGLVVAYLLSATSAVASGSVLCDGVTNTGGLDHFTKLGWQAFYGTRGKPSELWLDNHTKATVYVIMTASAGFVDNTLVGPGGTKTMYFPDDQDVVTVECSLWSGQQVSNGGYARSYDPDVNYGGRDADIDFQVDDPDALGGVSVDVAPEGDVTNLDDLRGKILKAL